MIEVSNLSRYYGDNIGIKDVNFQVEKGEILGFLGPNGAGKTTTMRILAGFMPATEGKAVVAGYDVFEDAIEVKKRIGYMPENPPLYFEMTVMSYLKFVATIKGVESRGQKKKIDSVMGRVGLTAVKNRLIRHLSKGYKQRVGLAQAVLNDPDVLILDEPTIGLDPSQIIEVRNLIKDLSGERTVILSTHILPEVSMTCKRVIIINRGSIVMNDKLSNLQSKNRIANRFELEINGPRTEVVEKLKSFRGVNRVKQESGNSDNYGVYHIYANSEKDIRPEIAKLIIQSEWGLKELRSSQRSLEDVFLDAISKERGVKQ